MIAIVVLEAVAIGLLGVLVAGLLRSHAEILRRLHDLGAGEEPDAAGRTRVAERRAGGSPAFDVAGHRPGGGAVNVGVIGSSATLLAFMSSGCSTCASFWHDFAQGVDLPGPRTRLVIVTKGAEAESESSVKALAPPGIATVMSSQAWEQYAVPVAPYFILVDQGRVLGEGAAVSWKQVRSLLAKAVEDARLSEARGREHLDTGRRIEATEAELAESGIGPGHPSLYPKGGAG